MSRLRREVELQPFPVCPLPSSQRKSSYDCRKYMLESRSLESVELADFLCWNRIYGGCGEYFRLYTRFVMTLVQPSDIDSGIVLRWILWVRHNESLHCVSMS